MQSRYFTALEGLRGVVAIAIIYFHTTYSWPGYLGVEFFMMLSGFVMAHSCLDRPARPEGGLFVLQRLARLYPLHLLGLALFAASYLLRYGQWPSYADGTLFTLIQQLLLLHNVGFNPQGLTWNFPAWSISIEVWVNLIVFFVIPQRVRSVQLLLGALACYLVIYNLSHHLDVHHTLYWGWLAAGMVRGMAGFLLGWFAYRVSGRLDRVAGHAVGWNLFELLPLLALTPILMGPVRNAPLDFVAVILIFALMLSLAQQRGLLSRLLSIAPLQYLGRISYAVYLVHIPIQNVLYGNEIDIPHLGALPYLLLFSGCVLVVASLAHFWVEQPARRWFKAWQARSAQAGSLAVTAGA
ncbi:acyltransferase [Chitiniphilus shinanonensis]|uniref:Acyltransferase n=1 Tax=Chitiniphilus shinanonensis TaxID=553088 RepID=A0ABQ6BTN5_9NEIS|nr:acyltransferase [Chitiniphilus shinanonensis]GLS04964.1 acyltransferase [Chitiniphilus shinanonensis]